MGVFDLRVRLGGGVVAPLCLWVGDGAKSAILAHWASRTRKSNTATLRHGAHGACFDAGLTLNNMSSRLVQKFCLNFEVLTNLDKAKGKKTWRENLSCFYSF